MKKPVVQRCFALQILKIYTGCSLNIVFFQEFLIFCDLSFASTGMLLVVQKNGPITQISREDELLCYIQGEGCSCSSTYRGRVAINWEKTQLLRTPWFKVCRQPALRIIVDNYLEGSVQSDLQGKPLNQ